MLEHTFDTPQPPELEVSIPAGAIEIRTTEGGQTHLVVDGDERLLEEVEVRQDGDRIAVAYRGRAKLAFSLASFSRVLGGDGLHVRATVPHAARVVVKTASADTEIAGRLASLDLASVSGDLRVRGEIAGDATVKTVSGDARLERVGGDLSLQTVSGDLRAGSLAGSAETKTVSGDIRLEAVQAGDVRFTSVSGDVEIGIAQGSTVDVDAGSTSGELSSELPLSSDPPAVPSGGGPTVVVRGRTVSGDVRLFRAA